MTRIFWIAFGAATHALFFVTVYRLFPFLQQGGRFRGMLAPAAGTAWDWCLVDGLLAIQFGVVHSVLLLPQVRKALATRIPSPHYGCFFCLATCLSLLLAIEGWQPAGSAAWRLQEQAGPSLGIGVA